MALSPALQKMVGNAANKYKTNTDKARKPKIGNTKLRIIMDPNSSDPFWQDCAVHWIKPSKEAKPIAVVGDCDVVHGQPNPIGAAVDKALASAHDQDTKDLYNEWKSRKTVLFNAVDADAPEEPYILELSVTTAGKLFEMWNIYAAEGQNLFDSEQGNYLIVSRTGVGLNTKYDITIAPGGPTALPKSVLEKRHNLLEYVEREFFRGDEQKALNAIAQIAGVAVPQISAIANSAPAASSRLALTSPAASVAGAEVEDAVVDTTEETKTFETKTFETKQIDDGAEALAKQQRIAELKRKQAEELAALEAEAEAAAASGKTEEAEIASGNSGLSTDEEDEILRELSNLD